jgi:hypothetical protein
MNARVIGYHAEPTAHFRERLRQRVPLSDYERAEQDIIARIRNCDSTLIGRGRDCERRKVLLYGIYPVEVRVAGGKLITIMR